MAPGAGILGTSSEVRVTSGRSLVGVVVCVVTAGLLVNVYLAVLARVLTEAEYGRFVSFMSIVLLIAFGGFLPVEQEMARQFQTGRPGLNVFKSSAIVATGIGVIAAALVAGLVPWLVPALADPPIVIALCCLGLVCIAQFLVRGTLVGTGRLAAHGQILLGDSVLRLGFAAIVVLITTRATAGDFAIALVAAIAVAHLPMLVWTCKISARLPGSKCVPSLSWHETGARVGHLIAGSISSQVLLNAPPILVAAVASSGEEDVVGRFAATFTLARVLLFVAVPLQSALVPIFTRLLARSTARGRRLLAIRIGVGALLTAGLGGAAAWVVGPELIGLVFGSRYALGSTDIALMVAGAMLYLGLIVAAQALVGANQHRDVGRAWLLGLLVAIAVFVAVPDLLLRVELFFAAGSSFGLVFAVVCLWRADSRVRTSANPEEAGKGTGP